MLNHACIIQGRGEWTDTKTGCSSSEYYSFSEVQQALQDTSKQAKLLDVTSCRLVVLGSVDTFQAGFAGFTLRMDHHEVPFRGLWTTVLDQKRFFYGGDAFFFGRLSNGGRFLPEEVFTPPLFSTFALY